MLAHVRLSAAAAFLLAASCATQGRSPERPYRGPRPGSPSSAVDPQGDARLAGFYTRRARNQGFYFDRPDIRRLGPRRTSEIIRHVPGLRTICDHGPASCTVRSTISPPAVYNTVRGQTVANGDCPIQYFVDGSPQPVDFFHLDDVRPEDIAGLEIYTRAATVPSRFNRGGNARCGVIVVWTGGGRFH